MIAEFSITNFGSVWKKQTLSMIADNSDKTHEDYYVTVAGGLRLLKLAMLYGPNASGKTTILKSLDVLRNLVLSPKAQKSEPLGIFPFQFDSEARQSPTVFQLVFVQKDIRYNYTVEVTNEYVLREKMLYYPNGRQAELFSRETDIESQTATIRTGNKSGLSTKGLAALEGNTICNNTVIGAFGKTNVEWPGMLAVQEWFKDTLQHLLEPNLQINDPIYAVKSLELLSGYEQFMVSLLEKADVQIDDLKIVTEEKELGDQEVAVVPVNKAGQQLVEDHKVTYISKNTKLTQKYILFRHKITDINGQIKTFGLPFDYQSHGTKQYFWLATIMVQLLNMKKCILIDELETGLHPDLIKHFILLFFANASQSQLILTTHNIQFFEEQDIIRKDAIWFTEKQADGSTSLYSLADFDSGALRKNTSIINAYRTGKLGAKPNPGSIFLSMSK